MKLLRYIFFPIVPIYYVVTWLRNKGFDLGILKSKSYDFPVICVGNLSVGGTGKTPMIEYLIRLLKNEFHVATLSRGYKRKSTGFQVGGKGATADILGDEPFQFYNKYNTDITVAVDADRRAGIDELLRLRPKPDVILLDDAYQHRKVKAGLNILLTTYSNIYTQDVVLPTGNLREPRAGAKRAQLIVVTKCPENLQPSEKENILKQLNPNRNQQVFFSHISYAKTVVSKSKSLLLSEVPECTLITGIANPTPLLEFLKQQDISFNHLNYKDHHDFTAEELKQFESLDFILTTEKDYMRLMQYPKLENKLFYLSIEAVLDHPQAFNSAILNFIQSY